MNLKRQATSKREFFTDYVRILNGILRLSNREAEVFSILLATDAYGIENINHRKIRDLIRSELKISEANLSKYLGTLKEKKLIIRLNKGWGINPYIRPTIGDNELVEITVTLEIIDAHENKNMAPSGFKQDTN